MAPALRRHGFSATAFLITSKVGEQGQLSWGEARNLASEGVLDFHTHTHTHQKWALGPEAASIVADELSASRAILADRLGQPESQFNQVAWPFGRACEAWEDEADRLGMRTQFVVQRGAVDRRQTRRLPRLLADGMAPSALGAWMRVLARPSGARSTNRVFGTIRHFRQGAAFL